MRFAVFNDLHAQLAPNPQEPGYPGANERAAWLRDQVAPRGALADVDFVVGGGDLIHGENLASIRAELAALRGWLAKLPVPYYPCCGNHEIRQAEGVAAYEAPYVRAFGRGKFDYVIPAGPAEIIVLNNGGTFHVTARRREARAEAFKKMLTARPGVPKIIICHVPLVPVRDRDVLRESFGFISHTTLEGELLDLLDQHGAAVRLVLSGHLHLSGMIQRRGVRHCVASGTASFPHDFAVVTITGQAIEVELRGLPVKLRNPATNIHGVPRWRRGFTDAAHCSHAAYLRGNAGERKFRVPLKG